MKGLIYKAKTHWYIFKEETDYPNKPLLPRGFSSRKEASRYLEVKQMRRDEDAKMSEM